MNKPLMLTMTALVGLAFAGVVAAETPSKTPAPHHEASPATAKAAPGGMGAMNGGGMGTMGMMGGMGAQGGMGMMGGGMCPMMAMGGAETQVAVKNIEKGVTITLTSGDPARVTRLQKMAEAMRLMHEATAP
jgi:hypothetical protein